MVEEEDNYTRESDVPLTDPYLAEIGKGVLLANARVTLLEEQIRTNFDALVGKVESDAVKATAVQEALFSRLSSRIDRLSSDVSSQVLDSFKKQYEDDKQRNQAVIAAITDVKSGTSVNYQFINKFQEEATRRFKGIEDRIQKEEEAVKKELESIRKDLSQALQDQATKLNLRLDEETQRAHHFFRFSVGTGAFLMLAVLSLLIAILFRIGSNTPKPASVPVPPVSGSHATNSAILRGSSLKPGK